MNRTTTIASAVLLAALAARVGSRVQAASSAVAQEAPAQPPTYEIDTSWPPKLPNNWVMGVPSWVFVDRSDHVWVLHRPRTAPADQRGNTAPPVIEFDANGKFLQAWGGAGQGFDWPDTEHSIFIDHKNRVWITGINPNAGTDVSTRSDDMILKFTRRGKFLQQIGGRDVSGGNADTKNPKKSAEIYVYPKTDEAFVADGYGNRRVWVIDGETGKFKRQWGAFGNNPTDRPAPVPNAPPDPARTASEGRGPEQFDLVHGTKVSDDGLVYVADRSYRRIQVFSIDGKYQTQGFINRATSNASCDTVAFSPDKAQKYLYCPDFNRGEVVIIDRKTLEPVATFSSRGAAPGQMQNPHTLAIDSRWNVYTAEVAPGRRLQKFRAKMPGTK